MAKDTKKLVDMIKKYQGKIRRYEEEGRVSTKNDKEKKKAIAVKYWCGNPNCEKELDPKKLKSCSRCKVIKYCCRDCQTVSE